MSAYILEFAFASILFGFGALALYHLNNYYKPVIKAKKYINYYKIGRICQYGEENKINVQEIMDKEEKDSISLSINNTPLTQRIENEIFYEIGEEIPIAKDTSKKK